MSTEFDRLTAEYESAIRELMVNQESLARAIKETGSEVLVKLFLRMHDSIDRVFEVQAESSKELGKILAQFQGKKT